MGKKCTFAGKELCHVSYCYAKVMHISSACIVLKADKNTPLSEAAGSTVKQVHVSYKRVSQPFLLSLT